MYPLLLIVLLTHAKQIPIPTLVAVHIVQSCMDGRPPPQAQGMDELAQQVKDKDADLDRLIEVLNDMADKGEKDKKEAGVACTQEAREKYARLESTADLHRVVGDLVHDRVEEAKSRAPRTS